MKNRISNTDLEISPVSIGTWVFGGKNWGGVNEDDCIEAIHAAIDHGINCIDTAPIYGFGKSETIIGKALKGKRDKFVIATKCGMINHWGKISHNLTEKSIRKELEESLSRLQTDYIDLYQCHWPDDKTPLEETFGTLNSLQEEGKIGYIGVSNYGAERIKKVSEISTVVTSQDQYSLLDRKIEEDLLPHLNQEFIGLLAYGPLAGGILSGKYKSKPRLAIMDARRFFYKYYDGKKFKETQNILNQLQTIGKPLGQVAINWVRQQAGVATVLVGCRNKKQVEDNAKALSWELSEEELTKINDIMKEKVHG